MATHPTHTTHLSAKWSRLNEVIQSVIPQSSRTGQIRHQSGGTQTVGIWGLLCGWEGAGYMGFSCPNKYVFGGCHMSVSLINKMHVCFIYSLVYSVTVLRG